MVLEMASTRKSRKRVEMRVGGSAREGAGAREVWGCGVSIIKYFFSPMIRPKCFITSCRERLES